jgi:hypothetical protein
MVPHISAIALSIPEPPAAAPSLDQPGAAPMNTTGRAVFAEDASSPGFDWVANAESISRESEANLGNEVNRVLSGARLQPADMLRLRSRINTNMETHMLYKKLSDSVVQGVQTLVKS